MKKFLFLLFCISPSMGYAQTSDSDSIKKDQKLTTTLLKRSFIRKEATESSVIVENIAKGTKLEIVELIENSDYRKVKFNGKIGYVKKSSCELDNDLIYKESLLAVKNVETTFLPTQTSADSLKIAIMSIKTRIDKIEMHLANSHKTYKGGTIFFFIGTAMALAGVASASGSNNPNYYYLAGIGGLLQTVGGVIWISSHKHIGYAGKLNIDK